MNFYRKSIRDYLLMFLFILASIYLAWMLGRIFITNISVNKPNYQSYRIYQNSLSIRPIPIYILQLGVYNDNRTAQNEAKRYSSKGIVTYLANHDNYQLITDVYTQEEYLKIKKEQLEKKDLRVSEVKKLISNDKQYLSIIEKENLHNLLNQLYTQYTDWLKKNELYWAAKEGVKDSTIEKDSLEVTKKQIIDEYNEIEDLLDNIVLEAKEEKLKDKLRNLSEITKQYNDNFAVIGYGSDSKGYNLAKGQLLACWDHFQYLYEYIGDEGKVNKYFN